MAPPPQKEIAADHFSPDTLEFIRLLAMHGVKYLIIGGEAVIFHGYARFTGDVDFFYLRDAENSQKLFAALQEFWSGDVPGLNAANELLEPGLVVQFGRPPNRIDLLNAPDGLSFERAWSTKEEVAISGSNFSTYFLSLEQLILNKRAAGRAKDQDDLTYLERRRR
jgi:hypothetical protein